ncbi:Glycosyl hydrolase family 47 protein [Trichomonas vaginalis G3]|uniref:alpha-1,2-Mannosidase n=2 Tax=Trichomonas vaginalis (strain ATCC PRA-98 / G3) TaxID=412133 RepID=A2E4P6_TRIV3|nr:Glycosyl hydrolase family 47 protein [Trichomonas vaginalis G3]|eukprot:XP_001324579.1 glycosyl hydrolase [Trichomonas vaginalis G3]
MEKNAKPFLDLYGHDPPIVSPDYVKLDQIKEAFRYAWNSYKRLCWGHDLLNPSTGKCEDTLHGGLTIVDSLTSLILMNLTEEYKEARNFVETKFSLKGTWTPFEFIIRYLASFESAYQLTNDTLYLEKAQLCMDLVFDLIDNNGNFYDVFTITNRDGEMKTTRNYGETTLALIGTLQLEFLTMTAITKNTSYVGKAFLAYRRLFSMYSKSGFIYDLNEYKPDGFIKIGEESDSFYEYILKTYFLSGGISYELFNRHLMFMDDVRKNLVNIQGNMDIYYIGTNLKGIRFPHASHLSAFLPGMITMGTIIANSHARDDFELATNLVEGYVKTANLMKTGLLPEEFEYKYGNRTKKYVECSNANYHLRPEVIESIYYLWKMTGDEKYREYNWEFFKKINTTCRMENGFSPISDVDGNYSYIGNMESYFFSETLKYLFLTFSDSSYMPMTEWIFNTEGHPFKKWNDLQRRDYRDFML